MSTYLEVNVFSPQSDVSDEGEPMVVEIPIPPPSLTVAPTVAAVPRVSKQLPVVPTPG